MTVRLPSKTFVDTKSGRETWGRAVVDALGQIVANSASAGGAVTDGDYGDIVVSGGVWSFDTGVVTAFAKTFLDDANAGAVRTTLGLGTIATQAANSVSITGGSITGITDLAVADGGTGASTAAAAATNLGLGTGDSPQFTAINLGHASDTTITRVSAGVVAIEGVNILTTATGQGLDATLTALAAYNTNGLLTQTAADTFTGRTITAGLGVTVTNGSGVSGNPTVAITSGSSNPGSPSSGDKNWRTDLKLWTTYDGTRWVSDQLFVAEQRNADANLPFTTTGNGRGVNPWGGVYDIYVERVTVNSFTTTTTATNFHTIQFIYNDGAGSGNIGSAISLTGTTQNQWVCSTATVGAVVTAAQGDNLQMNVTRSGTASAFILGAIVYRLVIP